MHLYMRGAFLFSPSRWELQFWVSDETQRWECFYFYFFIFFAFAFSDRATACTSRVMQILNLIITRLLGRCCNYYVPPSYILDCTFCSTNSSIALTLAITTNWALLASQNVTIAPDMICRHIPRTLRFLTFRLTPIANLANQTRNMVMV